MAVRLVAGLALFTLATVVYGPATWPLRELGPSWFVARVHRPLAWAWLRVLLTATAGIGLVGGLVVEAEGQRKRDKKKKGEADADGRLPPPLLPGPGDVIAAAWTSPLDALVLAAAFDPTLAIAWPDGPEGGKLVAPTSPLAAAAYALCAPETSPSSSTGTHPDGLVSLAGLAADSGTQARAAALFPECTPSNGRAVLALAASPALAALRRGSRVYPARVCYDSHADECGLATPVPVLAGGVRVLVRFLWTLLGRPMRAVRVRVGDAVEVGVGGASSGESGPTTAATATATAKTSATTTGAAVSQRGPAAGADGTAGRVAEGLARLGRVRRVGLGVSDKQAFARAWAGQR